MGDTTVESILDVENEPVIYVTGFGPFPPHAVNSSEVAVRHLDVQQLEKELGAKIYVDIIRVEYDYVRKFVNQRWAMLKPKLVVHVGVSGQAETLVLEQLAHNSGYNKQDTCGCLPNKGTYCSGGEEVIQSEIRMDLVSKALNNNTVLKLPCVKSTDPGRFLCDFIYYTSLRQDKSRVAFIHVPTLNKFPKEDIADAISMAIKEMYNQVLENDAKATCKAEGKL
ncbi:Pyroglutamyl-peptidase 1 [Halocaridina rubra]|uniref:Pyroglutamyl-peptidase 1 n=1 Tax=Halocaridina rubra TaxID=373956 RepID=A0AAN8X1B7_HALRR